MAHKKTPLPLCIRTYGALQATAGNGVATFSQSGFFFCPSKAILHQHPPHPLLRYPSLYRPPRRPTKNTKRKQERATVGEGRKRILSRKKKKKSRRRTLAVKFRPFLMPCCWCCDVFVEGIKIIRLSIFLPIHPPPLQPSPSGKLKPKKLQLRK